MPCRGVKWCIWFTMPATESTRWINKETYHSRDRSRNRWLVHSTTVLSREARLSYPLPERLFHGPRAIPVSIDLHL